MNTLYKLSVIFGSVLLPVRLLADGEASNNWDFTVLTIEAQNLKEGYINFTLLDMLTVAVLVVSAGVSIWLLLRIAGVSGLGRKK